MSAVWTFVHFGCCIATELCCYSHVASVVVKPYIRGSGKSLPENYKVYITPEAI